MVFKKVSPTTGTGVGIKTYFVRLSHPDTLEHTHTRACCSEGYISNLIADFSLKLWQGA